MIRKAPGLVSYESSDDENTAKEPVPKKRKLPALTPSLVVPAPIDNPVLHQGRIRTVPHVDGQYAAYIYVPLILEPTNPLNLLIEDALNYTKQVVPSSYEIGIQDLRENVSTHHTPGTVLHHREFHISLSRPIFLRAHQRDELKRAIKTIAMNHSPFEASFAMFTELTNDERTRTFLTAEVGAGHQELRSMSQALTPVLKAIRQKEFYVEPRFHASIAWALLASPSAPVFNDTSLEGVASSSKTTPLTSAENNLLREPQLDPQPEELEDKILPNVQFPRIPHFPADMISSLNSVYGARLSSVNVGSFDIDEICVRIGKNVFRWNLKGRS
ncbi:hypothetical protein SERLA73DRAFT_91348 [Serpula lacrymans var. lacrymans S7.3]|uniref:U6 snRNA phosphodiesterase n=2 Tax=Serpula lacrymans var. lacrymans TaxID=341189 RepID=F8Q1E3_SERL3|nr:uncharacterized protein SERLADRAFT_469918 [Serpula lacrymans var. lacrymans S7.9]EGN98121.1 hypothetical protein SERLA73DRAFT_91348 [Serpula lacrymans var. lacrymans S7.3]EGO23702.1 hypothetical protein SERLADRAFT_469918 [Serpula lacrymans var. lacrymans S7.9]